MGGGKDKKKTNQMIDTSQQVATGEHGNFQNDLTKRVQQNDQQTGASRDYLQATIGGVAGGNYNVDPNAYSPTGDFTEARGLYRGFADTGGVSEGTMRGAHPIFQDVASNPQIAQNMRANGTYSEFNQTGGLNAQDQQNIRSRATSGIPGYYQQMKQAADRAGVAQGGYGPGTAALQSRLSRQQVGAGADAALNAELGIKQQVNQGRMFGAQGMTGAEGSLQGLRLGAGGALDQSEANIQNTLQRGRMFGAQGVNDISSQEAQIAQANANRSAGIAEGNAGRMFGRDTTAAGMAAGLYGQDVNQGNVYSQGGLADRGLTYGTWGGNVQNRIGNNPRRDYLGMVLGAAGPIMQGAAGF